MNAEALTIEAEENTDMPAIRREQDNAPGAATPMAMMERAFANQTSPETLEKMWALQERWEQNQARKAFDEAMAAAKAQIPTIRKNRTVDFTSQKGRTHYRHEDLAEIASTVNPILGQHGLSYRYRVHSEINAPIMVTCIVSHRMGHCEETTLTGPRDESGNKNSLQQVGSTLTYLQRMTLKAALGLAASADDDGRAGGARAQDTPIDGKQAERIGKLIEDTGTDMERFCRYMGVGAVPDIAASQFSRAIEMLEKKRQAG